MITTMPGAAVATIAAALDDYRNQTPTEQQTPRGAAEYTAMYLASEGWGLYVPTPSATRPRARCPHCTAPHLINSDGRLRRHGPHANPCPGSWTPIRCEPHLATQATTDHERHTA